MKILLVHPQRKIQGGAEEVIDQLRTRLPEHGIRTTYISYRKPKGRIRDLYTLWREANDRICWGSFDLVNCHNFPATVAVWPACKKLPCVWTCNEPAEMFTSTIRKPLEAFNRHVVSRFIKRVVVPDKASQIRVHGIYRNVETRLIPYGIDYGFYSQRDGAVKPDGFTMLHVGTISAYKNQMASLKLLAKIKDRIKDAKIVFAGHISEPDYFSLLMDYITANDLKGRVLFTGHIDKPNMRLAYQSSDVLLHPAKQQGGWLAPFEAMSAGLPVVVWKSCLASLSLNEEIGIVVDEHTPVDALVTDMNRNPQPYRLMAERGQQWVAENMSWDKYTREVANYFKEVAGR